MINWMHTLFIINKISYYRMLNFNKITKRLIPIALLSSALLSSSSSTSSALSSSTSTCSPLRNNYKKLTDKLIEIESLAGVQGLLNWDEMVMMQSGSETSRNEMKAFLTGVIQEKQTSPDLKDILYQIKNDFMTSSELSNYGIDFYYYYDYN